MNGIFAYDGPIFRDKNGVFCDAVITDQVLNRYLEYVDHLYVLIRVSNLECTHEDAHLIPILSEKITVVEMPNFNTLNGFISKRNSKKQIASIIDICDMFFLRIPGLICNEIANLCIKNNKPYLVEVGGDAFDAFWNHSIAGKIIAPYMFWSQRHAVLHATFATYVTDKWLQNRYPTKGYNKPASNVYLSEFNEDCIKYRIERYKTSAPKTYTIGTLASVDVRSKGQDLIIKAMSKLKKRDIVLRYELVGAGDPSILTEIAKKYDVLDQVVFLGHKRHDEIWTWLDSIDIYAQPSKQEGLPRAVIEGLNRGCLCIGSIVAGIPELLEDDELFPVGDVNAICDVIRRIVSEVDHTARIQRNFEKSKKYSLDKLNTNRKDVFSKYKQSVL